MKNKVDIECYEGWKSLYEPLIVLCDEANVSVFQVKEKFGTLRFYVGPAPDYIYDAIEKAELKSETTCEVCGQPGKVRNTSWIKVRCEECYSAKE